MREMLPPKELLGPLTGNRFPAEVKQSRSPICFMMESAQPRRRKQDRTDFSRVLTL